ncbi:post-transcriptional regulator [Salirhabdus salicampi]|uniref:post-transcriptional regulator n=1 Tax=Salirhabdus salicampi TaxID=476102 RepID=UPI0020C4D13C|nr:post-transcriptional regulator [Salirhabdus salicampi]MCP8616982.1 post-transcriptional regulator [Salirhabdus salicampi]
MKEGRLVSSWKPIVLPALRSKVEELHMLGYRKANEEDVWKCLMKKVWRQDVEKKLHQVVQDILHLDAGIYMNYITSQVYKNDDLMAHIEALKGYEESPESE